ncbi:MAG: outer membrane lipid asymmetry maintenance protein MlaD [Pseudomonadota bacterium]
MRESLVETLLGAVVLLVALFFLWFALANGADASSGGGRYDVTARFNNVSGISRGSDVRLAGVKIGVVKSIESDFDRYEAVVTLAIDEAAPLPDDTDARISTDGLLGGAYIALEPGAGMDYVATDGTGEIIYTRGSVDLLTLFASFASGSDDDSGSASSPAADDAYPE